MTGSAGRSTASTGRGDVTGRPSSVSSPSRANTGPTSRGGDSRANAGSRSTAASSLFDRQQSIGDAVDRPGRGALRDSLPDGLGDSFDDFFNDSFNNWNQNGPYLNWWYNNWYGFYNPWYSPLFPYGWGYHSLFFGRHPFFYYFNWYHFWFGYYPIYTHWYYPSYVSYQPVYAPRSTTVVYYPTYATADVQPAAATTAGPDIPPALAHELYDLSQNHDAVVDLETGARLLKEGDYLGAADAFRRAAVAEPNNAVPKFALAHALFATGDYEYAAFLVRRGMELLPDWPTVGTSLHELYGDPDDLQEHIIALSTYVAAHPESADGQYLMGYVEYFTGNLDGAEQAFRAVEAANPYRADVAAFLSRIAEIRLELQRQQQQQQPK